jgi:hypothetical protein
MKLLSPLERICHLPLTCQKMGTSPAKIVSDSCINVDSLTTRSISDVLRLTPSLVDTWLRWSEGRRVSHGWYFQKMEHGYVVGFHPRGERLVFEDGLVACADFILREVRSIN